MTVNYKFKTKPYDHQCTSLEQCDTKDKFAFFMEMGTGKSKVLIDNLGMMHLQGLVNFALIIAPKGVYRNWERQEIPTHMPEHVLYNVVTWSPSQTKKQDTENRTSPRPIVFIINCLLNKKPSTVIDFLGIQLPPSKI